MKKIICLILSLALVFSFAACGKEKEEVKENSVDIEYFAKLGQIPECEYKLGADVETLKDELSKQAEENDTYYEVQEGEETVLVYDGKHNFYYLKDEEEAGISYIASYDNAFGFEIGEISLTVKEALGEIDFVEEELSSDNAFFIFGAQNGSVIKCEIGKNTLMFVFDNNALCATALFVTEKW